ncbi:MAG: hypothetical protein Fur0012_12120 [Elusimicrobiota bacterium]
MPDGNFVSCGGWVCSGAWPNECSVYSQTNACQIYSTTASVYGSIGALNITRSSHTLTVLSDGRLLVAGGYSNTGAVLRSLEVYNPATNIWTNLGNLLSSPRGGHTANLIPKGPYAGDVLICGGQTSAAAITNTCDIFITSTNAISPGPTMISQRFAHASAVMPSGKIFFSGGLNNLAIAVDTSYNSSQEIYDPVSNSFTPANSLMESRAFHNITTLNNGNILIIGGYNHRNQRDIYSLDKRGPAYMEGPDDVQTRQNQGTQGYLETFEMYDQNGARVVFNAQSYGTLPYRISKSATILKNDGTVNIVGGYGNIPVSYISSPKLTIQPGSAITVDHTNGRITGGTLTVASNKDLQLSRSQASGRLVESDFFLAPYDPTYENPSFSIENVKAYIGESTTTLDSQSVDCVNGSSCGLLSIKDVPLTLDNLAGISTAFVTWDPIDASDRNNITVASGKYTWSGMLDTGQLKTLINTSTISFTANFIVPEIYIGHNIYGTLNISNGQIMDDQNMYSVTMKDIYNVNVPTTAVVQTVIDGVRLGLLTVTFNQLNIAGQTIQSSTDGVLYSTNTNPAGDTLSALTGKLYFTSDGLDLTEIKNLAMTSDDITPDLSVGASTIVVRQMIMGVRYGFSPLSGSFVDNTLGFMPVFDNSGILTPATDMMFSSGLNCEYSPATDCLRTAPVFYPYSSRGVFVEQFYTQWPNDGYKLNQKRAKHTSTVLPDSSVLVCGGTDGTKALQSCELLDPKTGNFVYTSSMTVPRVNHTATLLSNGNVLIAGGTLNDSQYSVVLSSAEIYYPDTKRFVPTSQMNTGRTLHTATLLADGNVLVVGGAINGGYANYGEVYISSAAKWETTQISAGANSRQEHTATFMKNNTVLIAGGINGSGVLNTSYIYTPSSRLFTAANPMSTPRKGHTANLLKDGRVLVVAGSDGSQALDTVECYRYDTANWTTPLNSLGLPVRMLTKRNNHRTLLLPNGKVLITGGENAGLRINFAEMYNVDFPTFTLHGFTSVRQLHTSVILASGTVVNIGGYDGQNYLDTSDYKYFSATPDSEGIDTTFRRRPVISTATAYVDRGKNLTLMSATTNFHSMSEAASGSAGGKNSSHSNPRIYLSAVDNPSSFLVDLTTRIYAGLNPLWEKTQSSMTITMPSNPGELPYGWYYLYAVSNAQFSEGYLVQVTTPRPRGAVNNFAGVVLSSYAVQWTWWNLGNLTGAEGYAIFASSNNVFISTKALDDPATFIHTNLEANTPSSIKVTGYNFGGYGSPLVQSATYYTFANRPINLTIAKSGFNSIELEWSPNGNSDITPYEVSLAEEDPTFTTGVSTPVPFSNNHITTSTVISSLTPNRNYYFRVRAMNGDGITTLYDPDFYTTPVSTITIGTINNLGGSALSVSQIYWAWDAASGADGYQVYDVTYGTTSAVYIGSTTVNNYIQSSISTNSVAAVEVRAYRTIGLNTIYGPFSVAPGVSTLAAPPLPGVPNSYINVTTGSITVNWISNGNPSYTSYIVAFSSSPTFESSTTYKVVSTSYTIYYLTPNSGYYARIYAVNQDDIPSSPISLGGKYTLARPPSSVKPTDISLSGVTLTWDELDNSTMTIYQIRVSTDINMTPYTIPLGASFSDKFTGNYYDISGLWTNTTYYMDVTAQNMEGILTASVRANPNAVTLSGPAGAPPLSIGGTSDPTKDVVIQGVLPPDPFIAPDVRTLTLTIPNKSFETPTAVAISSSAENSCGWLVEGTHAISFNVYSDSQPKEPVTLKFNYTYNEAYSGTSGIDSNRTKIALARFNPQTGQCIPLETTVDQGTRQITAKLNHFSLFQLMVYSPATNLNNVKVFPNPFYPNKGQGYITITGMPSGAKISIYSLSGDLLFETTSNGSGNAYWEGKNKKGFYVGSGVYLCVIKSSVGKKVVKIAVER